MKFRHCIDLLHRNGQLADISAPVSPHLEMAAIIKRVIAEYQSSPVLLFHSIAGSSFSCVANLFGTTDRLSMILSGTDGLDLSERMAHLDGSVQCLESFMSWMAAEEQFKPKEDRPPEMVRHDDLSVLPAIKVWPQDAGHYLSLAVVIIRTRQGQHINCGIYRVQIHGTHQATIRFRPGSDGEKIFAEYQKYNEAMPVAIVLGCDPALIFAAVFPLSSQTSEFCFASYIQQQPLSFYCSELNSLPIPTSCEVVIQGTLDPVLNLPEGPFGNHEGYYSDIEQCPVFNLDRIESRVSALIPVTMVGGPPTENMVLGSYIAELIIPLVKRQIPQVLAVFMPPETVFHGCAFVQLCVDDQLENVKHQVRSHPLFARSKLLVFVDEDLDIEQPHHLFWRVMNHYYHSSDKVNIGTTEQIVIDAIGCLNQQDRLHSNSVIEKQVTERWLELGLDSLMCNEGS